MTTNQSASVDQSATLTQLLASELLLQLEQLETDTRDEAKETLLGWNEIIADCSFLPAAANLARYLALRERDLSLIQSKLAGFGLSSLGRSESHVAASLQAVHASLARIAGLTGPAFPTPEAWSEGPNLLAFRKRALFGPVGPAPAVMVTMPTEAAEDYDLVHRLVGAGMNCARINCAHDDADIWKGMIAHVRRAESALDRDCRILMDIGGPKCRITSVSPRKPERLHVGDRFRLLLEPETAPSSKTPVITVSFPEMVGHLRAGAEVWIDDGKIRSRVDKAIEGGWTLEVIGVRAKGEKLREEKGVNAPGIDLGIAPLGEDDLAALDFVAGHADLVGFSFVQRPSDIARLDQELARRLPGKALPPLVLKIETAEAVRNLPRLIVRAASQRPVAVMIARGDLAVALGFSRMAEVQEELLWLCEAACVPVVWATQVLDDLVQEGLPSRAEATDAAMAQRAECVMLNKGPYLVEAIGFLADVFARMDRHQTKKAARLAPLHSWPKEGLKI